MGTLWEKLLFWKKQKMLKEGVDYEFFNFENTDITGVKIKVGEFKDVIYHYHKARVSEEGDFARLHFGFTVVHPGNHTNESLQNNEAFSTIMGDILSDIILKYHNEQTRTDDNQEFDLQ